MWQPWEVAEHRGSHRERPFVPHPEGSASSHNQALCPGLLDSQPWDWGSGSEPPELGHEVAQMALGSQPQPAGPAVSPTLTSCSASSGWQVADPRSQ